MSVLTNILSHTTQETDTLLTKSLAADHVVSPFLIFAVNHG
ncbi:hypothetical protein DO62_5658 [Burkholderia pseudomallei]|nr:hypothetical protein DO62_5658 [Burkholderia pseudomallei]